MPPAKCGRGSRVCTLKDQQEVGVPARVVSGKTVHFLSTCEIHCHPFVKMSEKV